MCRCIDSALCAFGSKNCAKACAWSVPASLTRADIYIYIYLYRLGGCSTGKLFRFVRACVRAVWLPIVELDLKSCWSSLFTFSLGALSLFPLGPWASYPTLVRLIGVYFLAMYNEPHSAIYLSLSLSLSLSIYIQPGRLGHPPKSLCMDGYEEPN